MNTINCFIDKDIFCDGYFYVRATRRLNVRPRLPLVYMFDVINKTDIELSFWSYPCWRTMYEDNQ